MATCFQHAFLRLVVLTNCFMSAQHKTSHSDRPSLSLSKTRDVHFVCTMAGVVFNLNADVTVHAMQIQFTADQETDGFKTLATMDPYGQARPSPDSGRVFKVIGARPSNVSEWSLRLAFVEVGDGHGSGTYLCRVSYSEQKQQAAPFVWKSKEIPYFPESDPTVYTPGFELNVIPGQDMVCEYSIPGQSFTVTEMNFTAVSPSSIMNTTLARWSANNSGFCPSRVLCHPRTFVFTYVSLRAHMFNLTCDDQITYECSVVKQQSDASFYLSSNQETISLDFCSDTTAARTGQTPSVTTVTPSGTDTTTQTFTETGAVVVVMVLVAVMVAVTVCVKTVMVYRSKKTKTYKPCDIEDGSGEVQGLYMGTSASDLMNVVHVQDSHEGVRLPTDCTDPSSQIRVTNDGANAPADAHPQMIAMADVHSSWSSTSDDVNSHSAPTDASHTHPEGHADS